MQEVMEPILQIQVLGKFTLRYGETVISDEDDRSRKVWAVLAYLIYHREKIISQQELVDLCWGEDTRSSDPHNALKSVIHRIRATLDKLQEGDVFVLRVLDEVLTYEVDQIRVVEPSRVSDLEIVEGSDLCTLVTCTPYGINTHRLLVRGHRIENIQESQTIRVTSDAMQIEPLIVAPIVATPVLLLLLVLLLLPKRKDPSRGGKENETL